MSQPTIQAKQVPQTTPKTDEKAQQEVPPPQPDLSPQKIQQKTPTSYVGSTQYKASNNAAVQAFDKGDYFGAIVALNEGIVLSPYYDNRGQCIGEGYNYTSQTKGTNSKNFAVLSIPQAQKDAMIALSGTINSKTRLPLPVVHISLDDSFALVNATKPQYEAPAIARFGFAGFNGLAENQKAVLTYHDYKAGSFVPNVYPEMIAGIKGYIANKTPANEQNAASHFIYHYRLMSGEVKEDRRSGKYMEALFLNPSLFRDMLVKGGGPQVIEALKALPPLSAEDKKTMDSLKPDVPIDEQIPSEVQDIKYQALEEDVQYPLSISDDKGNAIETTDISTSPKATSVKPMRKKFAGMF
ncbi:MAG TPA: hypothetical protein VM577_19470 [Anaerovoracaceae bacterium]|nr:hypothetical protein [Anaerovoracaceae bacterium]